MPYRVAYAADNIKHVKGQRSKVKVTQRSDAKRRELTMEEITRMLYLHIIVSIIG